MSLPSIGDLPLEQRRIIRAWCMYDWANSAFATSIAAIVPIYFVFLFKEAAGDDGTVLGIFTGSSMWSLGVALSTGFVAFSSPVLGVIADRVPIRRVLLATYMTIGSVFTMLAFFAPYAPEPCVWLFVLF
ncbi:MAG: MFS transporter [Chloroflexi bacterium]|nr:MFS transporter [Chloroflexota bacterium]